MLYDLIVFVRNCFIDKIDVVPKHRLQYSSLLCKRNVGFDKISAIFVDSGHVVLNVFNDIPLHDIMVNLLRCSYQCQNFIISGCSLLVYIYICLLL